MAKLSYYTKEGFDKLKADLEQLKNIERIRISRQIAEARDKGDLSENAEYDAAKEAQGMLELQIAKMEDAMANARILDDSQLDATKALILSTVKIRNCSTGAELSYTLVTQKEANLAQGKISVDSPIGKGLLGKKAGESVEIQVPNGAMKFDILEISR